MKPVCELWDCDIGDEVNFDVGCAMPWGTVVAKGSRDPATPGAEVAIGYTEEVAGLYTTIGLTKLINPITLPGWENFESYDWRFKDTKVWALRKRKEDPNHVGGTYGHTCTKCNEYFEHALASGAFTCTGCKMWG